MPLTVRILPSATIPWQVRQAKTRTQELNQRPAALQLSILSWGVLALDNGSSHWTFTQAPLTLQQLPSNMVTTWLLPYFEEERVSPPVVPTEGKGRLSLSTSISLRLIGSDRLYTHP